MRFPWWLKWALLWPSLFALAVGVLLLAAAFGAWGCRYWQAFF